MCIEVLNRSMEHVGWLHSWSLHLSDGGSYGTDADTPLTVDASDDPNSPVGLLFNDTDPDGDPLTVGSVDDPAGFAVEFPESDHAAVICVVVLD